MQAPAYWWLLALVILVQGAFLVRVLAIRVRGNAIQPAVRRWVAPLAVSGGAGFAYGVVQSDPLFFLGQACLLIVYYRLHRGNNDKQQ